MKKKIFAIILSALMLLGASPLAMAATPGDIDDNGKVEATDARLALRAAVGLEELTAEEILLADADADGDVDATDARLILRAAVGLEELHVHSYTSAVTTKATCKAKGVKTFTCACGDSYTEDIPETGHKEVADKAVAPTCTEKGKTEGSHCSACNEVIKAQKDIAATGHKEVVDKAVAPTCTEKGKTEGSHCSVCDKVIKAQKDVAALGHTAVTDKAVAPTCTKTGLTEGSHCSVCDKVIKAQKEVAATGHKEVVDKAVDPTCTEKGKTEGSHCSVCDKVIKAQKDIAATGHKEVIDKAVAPTCTEGGLTEGSHCSVCNAVIKAQTDVPPAHKSVIDEAVSATCTESGLSVGAHCTECGFVIKKQKEVPALGHYPVAVDAVPVTCTENGRTKGMRCKDCNTVLEGAEIIPAPGHVEVIDPAVEPTETTPGLTEGSHCSVCNAVIKAQEEIYLHDHIEVVDKAIAPTCTEKGKTEGSHCSICNAVIKAQEEIPALGHVEVVDKAVAPTYTTTGLTEGSHCSVCNAVIKAQEIVPVLSDTVDHSKSHDFRAVSLTGTTKCAYPGCDAELPAFNDIVNGLKAHTNGSNYFTGIFEDIKHNDEPVISGALADSIEGEEMQEETVVEYASLVTDRLITQNNFHTKGEDFVSALTEGDVESISLERVSTVDFVGTLPDKFTAGNNVEYDLSEIKARQFPELYKVTLVLPSQNVDITKPVTGASVYDKIYNKDYNNTLEAMRKEVSGGFDTLEEELAGLESMVKMKNSGNIKSALVVEYYITTDTFTPVAAKYSHRIDVLIDIKLTVFGINGLTMTETMDMTSNSYYFFSKSF